MSHTLRRALVLLIAGAFSITALYADGRRRAAGPEQPTAKSFKSDQLEAYLTDDGIAYIRPGLKIKINSITIGSDRKPVIDLNITDDFDQPLDRLGKTTPGVISISFILAKYDPETRLYTSYTTRTATAAATSPKAGAKAIQASADSGGTWTDLETGHARYVFGTALPTGFDQAATTSLGVYSSRNLTTQIGKNYYANVIKDFRPDGQKVEITAVWDKIRDATSCLNCHDPLAMHGGSRRDVKLCVMCHSPQTSDPDTGESVDMAYMTHKIHSGHNLKNGYLIIGNANSVHNYSEVTYAQDRRNCWNCHEGTSAAASGKPAQADAWLTRPSARACGACHDTVNFTTGENHGHEGAQISGQKDDSQCARCHIPDSGNEFDASIKGAHIIPEKSKQLKGLTSQIVGVSDVEPGKKPTVVFLIKNGDGTPVDGSKLSTFSPISAGNTASYAKYFRENAVGKGTFDAATGTTSYTFTNAIPADAKGSWTFSADIYRSTTLKRADGQPDITGVRDVAYNPIKYVPLTANATATPRRTVVTTAQCNKCHDSLGLHGGQRKEIQECVICHNPTTTDVSVRPAAEGPPQSVSMQLMIHKIHSGVNLETDYTVFGYQGSRHNYNEITYPGDRRNCNACHVNNSSRLPLPKDVASVTTLRDYYSPMGPAAAACLSCHDSKDAAAHAYLNTTMFGGNTQAEACGACHGANSEWSTDKVHAR